MCKLGNFADVDYNIQLVSKEWVNKVQYLCVLELIPTKIYISYS